MDFGRTGSESQESDEPAPPGTTDAEPLKPSTPTLVPVPSSSPALTTTAKGVQNAKKRLRAFSIQKKTPLTPLAVPKTVSTGNATVLIGKLCSVKTAPKVDKVDDEVKKPPKPPKPGSAKKYCQESYTDLQKQTISEIENMKRKMELVELGIPLGLICPNTNEKAMPTKAMPPIKTFLDTAKVDELIREAKKARAEGKEFKFDYKKLLPDYDNPFQRKKEDKKEDMDKNKKETENKEDWKLTEKEKMTGKFEIKQDYQKIDRDRDKDSYRDKSKDKLRGRELDDTKEKYSKFKERDSYIEKEEKYKDKDDKYKNEKYRDKDDKYRDRSKESESKREERRKREKTAEEKPLEKEIKETNVNLSDYLVCDSWSLDTNNSSPKFDDKVSKKTEKPFDPMALLKESLKNKDGGKATSSPKEKSVKMEKLKPVNDSFKYEIDPNDDEVLEIFDEDDDLEAYTKVTRKDSPSIPKYGLKDTSMDGMNDDTFLESVINEIKEENMSDEDSQDKGLVEYDSPLKDDDDLKLSQGSRTPELNTSFKSTDSQRSDYSDKSIDSRKSVESYKSTDNTGRKSSDSGRKSTESGYRSTESGYKSTESDYKSMESGYKYTESGYKSTESGYKSSRSNDSRSSIERMVEEELAMKMPQSTVDSLETWSFVLKICQPLLFRHDRNKCYKETSLTPKLWYTVNPKLCNCVKDRSVVYEELEMCKMALVDQLYSSEDPSEPLRSSACTWYPRLDGCLVDNPAVPMSTEWDIEASKPTPRSLTPERMEDVSLDREYQKFMEAVWPDVAMETSGSTTPVKKESRKKKKTEEEIEEEKKVAKKIKLSSKSWSQESEVEEEDEVEKSKKCKDKLRKRKRSPSAVSSEGESDGGKKNNKAKKSNKKFKTKEAKKRRLAKKLQKLKEKRKKKSKTEDSEVEEEIELKKKDKKLKKKKLQKNKKKAEKKKKRVSSSSSSSTSSSSDSSSSETERERKKKKKKREDESRKKKKDKKKKRKQSTSDSTQSDDLFDVNVLNNIKTERVEEEARKKEQEFSPRQQKRKENREIISVTELHHDFSSNHIQVKKEIEMDLMKEATEKERIAEKEKTTPEMSPIEKSAQKKVTEDKSVTEKAVSEKKTAEKSVAEKMNTFDLGDDDLAEKIHRKEPQPTPPPLPTPVLVPRIIPVPKLDQNVPESQPMVPETPQPISSVENILRPSYEYSGSQSGDYKAMEVDEKFESYEQGNYEMYEQLAMQYQSDVASQRLPHSSPAHGGSMPIETVVRARARGEIKCDWRAGDSALQAAQQTARPSRWGLKPGEVNIVLTGADPSPEHAMSSAPLSSSSSSSGSAVFTIPSLGNRQQEPQPVASTGYDEAYLATYGVSDRLQYGDCFAPTDIEGTDISALSEDTRSSLDQRISRVLRDTVLGEVARDAAEGDKDNPEKGILVTKEAGRAVKRVSFADGYKPGQDSDVEEPPVKKKKKPRRYGCAWPCPAEHPDHVSLWDALPPPPPPPPPGSPPPPARPPPPLHLLRGQQPPPYTNMFGQLMPHPQFQQKFDPNAALPNFMPPEPPPGMISFP